MMAGLLRAMVRPGDHSVGDLFGAVGLFALGYGALFPGFGWGF